MISLVANCPIPYHAMPFTVPFQDPILVFALVLAISLLSSLLLSRIRVPSIVGLIIAGVIVGPHGFNLLERNASITLLGTVGLLYIMFLAGLKLGIDEFKRHQRRSIVFGALTFLVPLLTGLAIGRYGLGFSLPQALLVSSMFSTHTLIAYPIAIRLGIIGSEVTSVAVGGTIITDTVALLLLAVIVQGTKSDLNAMFAVRMGVSLMAFGAVIRWVFPPFAKWVFKAVEKDPVAQYVFLLLLVFLAAFLAQLAGVEPIIGAFLSGLVLNRLIPPSSMLMNRIDFTGNAIFIPFFLMGVGMLVDLRVLLRGTEALVVAGVLTATALASKWLAAWLAQLFFGYSIPQRNVLFGLSSAHAAATLSIILVGFNLGIVDENVLNGTILLILVTCLVSSFVVEHAGRELVAGRRKAESLPDPLPERILTPGNNPSDVDAPGTGGLAESRPGDFIVVKSKTL